MEKFQTFTGLAAPLDMANVDTDQIVPKQFLKRVERTGFGQFAFFNQRYLADGSLDPGFVLNLPRYQGAEILLARENFGSGSSREHAPWALMDYGFRVVVAPSFADIFRNNSFNNGLLLVTLPASEVDGWFQRVEVEADADYRITVDLENQKLTGSDGFSSSFDVDPFLRRRLLLGLDNIGLTLEHEAEIAAYEKAHTQPWRAGLSQ